MTLTPPTGERDVTAGAVRARFTLVDVDRLHEHEEVEPDRVAAVERLIVRDGEVRQPVVADASTLVVLDGHHRLNALRNLGATRVPVHLVDYADDAIVLEAWDPARPAPSKSDVLARARAGKPFPPKTTRHPRLYALPEEPTPLDALGIA